jgi:hypothetical protein
MTIDEEGSRELRNIEECYLQVAPFTIQFLLLATKYSSESILPRYRGMFKRRPNPVWVSYEDTPVLHILLWEL